MKILAGKLVNPGDVQEDVVIEIVSGRVDSIKPWCGTIPENEYIDCRNSTVIPGLIDIHVHGAAGDNFTEGKVAKASKHLARYGTTSFLATNYPCETEKYLKGIRRLRSEFELSTEVSGARMLGIHLEGPFFNPKHGAQSPQFCWPVREDNIELLLKESGDALKMVSLSPELAGAARAVEIFFKKGFIVAAAHTSASVEQMKAVYDAGLRHATHIFNAMHPPVSDSAGVLTPGCAEFVLSSKDMTADVMVDSQAVHVADEWVKILLKCLGPKRTALLSDAMPLAGCSAGNYTLPDGQEIAVKKGRDVVRLHNGGLAGSIMMMIDSVNNLTKRFDMRLDQAIELATITPARIIGIDNIKGSIETGKDADLVVVDENMNVQLTMVEGRVVYKAD